MRGADPHRRPRLAPAGQRRLDRALPDARGLRAGPDDPGGGRGEVRRPAGALPRARRASSARPPTTCPACRVSARAAPPSGSTSYDGLDNVIAHADEITGKEGDGLREHLGDVIRNRHLNALARRPRPRAPAMRSCPVSRLDKIASLALEVEVAHERVEAAVADHVAEVLAQRLALLAGDLVGVRDDVVEAVELVDPLGGEPRADTRARRAGCRRSRRRGRRARGSAPGGTPYFASTAAGRHPGQVGDPAHRVEHGRRRR